jgi:hypothetical protein
LFGRCPAPKGASDFEEFLVPVKRVRENSVVPPGLESFFPLFPALKRWAKFGRPSGAGLSGISFHRIAQKRVLTHTLKRYADTNPSFSAACFVRDVPGLYRTPPLPIGIMELRVKTPKIFEFKGVIWKIFRNK